MAGFARTFVSLVYLFFDERARVTFMTRCGISDVMFVFGLSLYI